MVLLSEKSAGMLYHEGYGMGMFIYLFALTSRSDVGLLENYSTAVSNPSPLK